MEDQKKRSMFLLKNAKEALERAKEGWEKELYSCYPVGAKVRVKRTSMGRWRNGIVDLHGYHGDLRVLVENGSDFWIRHDNHWGQIELA